MAASKMVAFDLSHIYFTDFEQVKNFNGHFADFKQVKNFSSHCATLNKSKILMVILMILNRS